MGSQQTVLSHPNFCSFPANQPRNSITSIHKGAPSWCHQSLVQGLKSFPRTLAQIQTPHSRFTQDCELPAWTDKYYLSWILEAWGQFVHSHNLSAWLFRCSLEHHALWLRPALTSLRHFRGQPSLSPNPWPASPGLLNYSQLDLQPSLEWPTLFARGREHSKSGIFSFQSRKVQPSQDEVVPLLPILHWASSQALLVLRPGLFPAHPCLSCAM